MKLKDVQQMKDDMANGVIICRSSWAALIEHTLKLEAMLQPADWDKATKISDVPAVHETIQVFSEDPSGDNAVGMVQAILNERKSDEQQN